MDKESLRKAFGEMNDVDPTLEGVFGNTYLDNSGTTREDVPPEISQFLNERGYRIINVGNMLGNAIENAPLQDCKSNQQIIINFFREHVLNQDIVSHDEWFKVVHHMDSCDNEVCHELYDISILDTFLNVDELRIKYNKLAAKFGLEKI